MAVRRHYDTKRLLPARSLNDSNAQTIDLGNAANVPVCVTAQGTCSPITNGTPGPTTYITWTPVSNPILDRWSFIGPVATQAIRIPVDGFYNFWFMIAVNSAIQSSFSLRSILDLAVTSDTGFTTPVWNTIMTGPSAYFRGTLLQVGGRLRWEIIYRGTEFHANDLIRFGLNMYNDTDGTVADQGATVVASEFRFVFAIPNDAIIQGIPGPQ